MLKYFIYCIADMKDDPMYVGVTHNLEVRFYQHSHNSASYISKWLKTQESVKLYILEEGDFSSFSLKARIAELKWINRLKPLLNGGEWYLVQWIGRGKYALIRGTEEDDPKERYELCQLGLTYIVKDVSGNGTNEEKIHPNSVPDAIHITGTKIQKEKKKGQRLIFRWESKRS